MCLYSGNERDGNRIKMIEMEEMCSLLVSSIPFETLKKQKQANTETKAGEYAIWTDLA
jgi:hypothetical protein